MKGEGAESASASSLQPSAFPQNPLPNPPPAYRERGPKNYPLGLMTVLRNGNRWDTSNVIFRDGRLVKYDKRDRTPEMDHIDYGVALLRMEAVDRIPTDRPFDLAELYTALVEEKRMVGFEVFERFYEIGTPESLEEARAYLQSRGWETE
jgi:NDP-sugar pyrophosphorylase family protein